MKEVASFVELLLNIVNEPRNRSAYCRLNTLRDPDFMVFFMWFRIIWKFHLHPNHKISLTLVARNLHFKV